MPVTFSLFQRKCLQIETALSIHYQGNLLPSFIGKIFCRGNRQMSLISLEMSELSS